jgi:hypothetical protein
LAALRILRAMNFRNLKIDFLGLLSVSVFVAFLSMGVAA